MPESQPADSWVLELPADEPTGDRLDVDAFVTDWPHLLESWKGPQPALADDVDGVQAQKLVGGWLDELRKLEPNLPTDSYTEAATENRTGVYALRWPGSTR